MTDAEFAEVWADTSRPVRRIAKEVGIAENKIYHIAATMKLPPRRVNGFKPIDEKRFAALRAKVEEEERARLAANFGISARTIRNTVTRLGLQKRLPASANRG